MAPRGGRGGRRTTDWATSNRRRGRRRGPLVSQLRASSSSSCSAVPSSVCFSSAAARALIHSQPRRRRRLSGQGRPASNSLGRRSISLLWDRDWTGHLCALSGPGAVLWVGWCYDSVKRPKGAVGCRKMMQASSPRLAKIAFPPSTPASPVSAVVKWSALLRGFWCSRQWVWGGGKQVPGARSRWPRSKKKKEEKESGGGVGW